ncbi:MAG: hypothetical protein ABIU87_09495, partial [Ornithinibacter sp.]
MTALTDEMQAHSCRPRNVANRNFIIHQYDEINRDLRDVDHVGRTRHTPVATCVAPVVTTNPAVTDPAVTPAHRVVVIGSGFGGLFGTQALKGRKDVEITLIATTAQHLFQPLLYQVATGILSEGE